MNLMTRRSVVMTVAAAVLVPAAFAQQRDSGAYWILQARYGTSQRNVDVMQRLQDVARAAPSFRVENDVLGVDPDAGRTKTLRIVARAPNGQTQVFEYREGDVLDGSRFAGWSDGRWGDSNYRGGWGESARGDRGENSQGNAGAEGRYRIQQALYGTARRNIDVTDRLRELARSERSFRLTNELFGTDPAEGVTKTLRIIARGPDRTTKTFEYREGSVIDGGQFAGWDRGEWGQDGRRSGWGR